MYMVVCTPLTSPTYQKLYVRLLPRGFGTQSQVFIGYGRIPSSTLYDNVEACPHESKAFLFGLWGIEK